MSSPKKITMIGTDQAKPGLMFEYLGISDICRECEFLPVCHHNLEKGRVYEVIKVRKKVHECPLNEGKVSVVDVVEPEYTILLDRRKALEGVSISFKDEPCNEPTCQYYDKCHPVGIHNGDQCKVNEVITPKTVNCPIQRILKIVKVRRV
ncbi:MAG: UPF0179 family protein [Candidatus Ranarchaeia archaeon]|jgi:uncharacterized protein (UPF0179 family)